MITSTTVFSNKHNSYASEKGKLNNASPMPLISVVVPAYNSEKTIEETIKSVLNQTLTDLEVIVINDGSTDSTLAIVEGIQDKRLQIFSYPNRGVAASRNIGITHSSCEFISFIDADDLWIADKLEQQLLALQQNPQAAVAYSWTDGIDENGNFLRPGNHITANGDVYKKLLVIDFIESGSNALIRRQALNEVGGFDETLTNAQDWDLWLRLARRFEFVAVPSVQILYRISTNSMSTNVWAMEASLLKVIERNYNQGPEALQTLKNHTLGSRYKYLTFKALEGIPSRKKGWASAQFFLNFIKYEPAWLRDKKTILIAIFKITVITLLPSSWANALLASIKTAVRQKFGKYKG